MRYAGRFVAENEGEDGICKILVGKQHRNLLGVHMLGNSSSEAIWGAALMIEQELRVKDVKEIIFPHPTVSEIIRETIWEFKEMCIRDSRERVLLATKLPVWLVEKPEDMERLFCEQLEKLRTDHVDVYLLHALDKARFEKMLEMGALDFMQMCIRDRSKETSSFRRLVRLSTMRISFSMQREA